jgi:steroid Delta-isomerase
MTEEDAARRTRRAVEAYVRAWAENDKQALLDVFAEDALWIDPVGTPPYRGHAEIAGFWDRSHVGGTTLTPEVQRIVACGSEAVLMFRMVVRGADGAGMAIDVCDHMTVNDAGKIQVAKAFWDQRCITPLAAS